MIGVQEKKRTKKGASENQRTHERGSVGKKQGGGGVPRKHSSRYKRPYSRIPSSYNGHPIKAYPLVTNSTHTDQILGPGSALPRVPKVLKKTQSTCLVSPVGVHGTGNVFPLHDHAVGQANAVVILTEGRRLGGTAVTHSSDRNTRRVG